MELVRAAGKGEDKVGSHGGGRAEALVKHEKNKLNRESH